MPSKPRHPPEVEAIVSFEVDARAAQAGAEQAQQRLASVKIVGARLDVHLQRIGVRSPRM